MISTKNILSVAMATGAGLLLLSVTNAKPGLLKIVGSGLIVAGIARS